MLYRVGETRGGAATYTPRMVFFERRGAMGGVSAAGYLYGDEAGTDGNRLPPILTWDGSAKVIEQPKEVKSRFVRQLEACDEDARDDDDDDDDENRDFPRSDDDSPRSDFAASRGECGSSAFAEDDADASGARPTEVDPLEALRARMAGHVLRAATRDDCARRDGDGDGDGDGDTDGDDARSRRVRSTEERRRAREAEARKENEAHAKIVEASETLETESRTWTDFSKASFHSRSAFLLDGVWSGVDAFGGFGEGVSWANASDRREGLRDVVRRWAEECDRMQGFQVFAEDLCGFGGLAAATLEELRDEYPRQPAWLFSLRPPKSGRAEGGGRTSSTATADAEAARYFLLNDALATATLAPLCDAYVPLGADAAAGSSASDALPPGFFGAEGRNRFRASALAAAFADVAGTSWRARGPTCAPGARDMRDVARHLSARAAGPFVAASFAVDAAPEPEGASAARPAAAPPLRFAGLTPGVRGDRRAPTARRETGEGLRGRDAWSPSDDASDEEDEPSAEAYASRAGERAAEMSLASLDAALRLERYRVPRLRCVSEAPLPLPLTFPAVFAGRARGPRFAAATARAASTVADLSSRGTGSTEGHVPESEPRIAEPARLASGTGGPRGVGPGLPPRAARAPKPRPSELPRQDSLD